MFWVIWVFLPEDAESETMNAIHGLNVVVVVFVGYIAGCIVVAVVGCIVVVVVVGADNVAEPSNFVVVPVVNRLWLSYYYVFHSVLLLHH